MFESRYAIDTSALICIEELRVPQAKLDRIWSGVFDLVEAERLFTVDYAFPELDKNNEKCAARLKRIRRLPFMVKASALMTQRNAPILRQIANNFPQMSGVGGPNNKADPWLVTLAYERDLIVITEEGTGAKQKIPAVCASLRIESIRVLEFVLRENLS